MSNLTGANRDAFNQGVAAERRRIIGLINELTHNTQIFKVEYLKELIGDIADE